MHIVFACLYWSQVVFDNLHLAAFPDHGLGYTILGPEDNINSLKAAQLKVVIFTLTIASVRVDLG